MAKRGSAIEKARAKMREKIMQRKKNAAARITKTPQKSPKSAKKNKRRSKTPTRRKSPKTQDNKSDELALEVNLIPSVSDDDRTCGWHSSGTRTEKIEGKQQAIQYVCDAVLKSSKKRVAWFEDNAEALDIRIVALPDKTGWSCKNTFPYELDGKEVKVKLTFKATVVPEEEEDAPATKSNGGGWGSVAAVKKDGWGMKRKSKQKTHPGTTLRTVLAESFVRCFVVALITLALLLLFDINPTKIVQFILSVLQAIGSLIRSFLQKALPSGVSNALPSS